MSNEIEQKIKAMDSSYETSRNKVLDSFNQLTNPKTQTPKIEEPAHEAVVLETEQEEELETE